MSPALVPYAALAGAIVCEVIGSAFLQQCKNFTRLGPTLAMALFYASSFYLMTHALKVIPLGIAYAIWAGVGIVLTALVGWLVLRQPLDSSAVLGMALIVAGVVVINLFSSAAQHPAHDTTREEPSHGK